MLFNGSKKFQKRSRNYRYVTLSLSWKRISKTLWLELRSCRGPGDSCDMWLDEAQISFFLWAPRVLPKWQKMSRNVFCRSPVQKILPHTSIFYFYIEVANHRILGSDVILYQGSCDRKLCNPKVDRSPFHVILWISSTRAADTAESPANQSADFCIASRAPETVT